MQMRWTTVDRLLSKQEYAVYHLLHTYLSRAQYIRRYWNSWFTVHVASLADNIAIIQTPPKYRLLLMRARRVSFDVREFRKNSERISPRAKLHCARDKWSPFPSCAPLLDFVNHASGVRLIASFINLSSDFARRAVNDVLLPRGSFAPFAWLRARARAARRNTVRINWWRGYNAVTCGKSIIFTALCPSYGRSERDNYIWIRYCCMIIESKRFGLSVWWKYYNHRSSQSCSSCQ